MVILGKMSKLLIFIQLLFIFVSLFQVPASAAKNSYIVYLGFHTHGSEVTEADLDSVTQFHHDFLTSFVGSKEKARSSMINSYKHHINGFAAFLDQEEAAEIAKHPKVVSVFQNKLRKLQTTHSWEFMSLEQLDGNIPPESSWNKARFGEDTIIANLDSGVWPEAESFNDDGYGPIPPRWKGGCTGDFPCNKKLIGAKYFREGYDAIKNLKLSSYSLQSSPRDSGGHGTHTLSTVGGNFVHGVRAYGVRNGTAKGGSPKARVAAYKVCWSGCSDADMMAGFDMAIRDGVDVISMSVGGPPVDYFHDAISIGSFHAVMSNITVVCSGGNSGPRSGTVSNAAPWIVTVAASTIARPRQNYWFEDEQSTYVQLGNGARYKGSHMSHSLPENKFYPLITGAQARKSSADSEEAMLCLSGTLDPEKVSGKILACLRGEIDRVAKGKHAARAGAAGMILCNSEEFGSKLNHDRHVLPATQITYKDGRAVFEYIESTSNPVGLFNGSTAQLDVKRAPMMASFSSRGPNTISPQLLKPDITAPGVKIIAAVNGGKNRFQTMSGTSMSCPHVAGTIGLLKTLHPDWSTAAYHSAIMTTATTKDNRMEPMQDGGSDGEATPFAYGSGHIQPNQAIDPGLVYDLSHNDYLYFLCSIGYNQRKMRTFGDYECPKSANVLDFNYPTITVVGLSDSAIVTRKLKNVGSPGNYTVTVTEPQGISVSVEPNILNFGKIGEEMSFKVTLKPKGQYDLENRHYVFGGLNWSDGKHNVWSPVVVSRYRGW